MINKISVTTKSNKKFIMSLENYTRWLCLVEAIEFINQKANDSKLDLDKTDSWIKPLAIQKYIKQRYPSLYHDFKIEEHFDFDVDNFMAERSNYKLNQANK